MKLARIGLDTAQQVFQVHGVDAHDKTRLQKQQTRARIREVFANVPPCLVGMEACAGTHEWAQELGTLGHTVRLMAGQFVAPYRIGVSRSRCHSGRVFMMSS